MQKTLILLTLVLTFSANLAVAAPKCWDKDSVSVKDGSFLVSYKAKKKTATDLLGFLRSFKYQLELKNYLVFGDKATFILQASPNFKETREEMIKRVDTFLAEIEKTYGLEIHCNGIVHINPSFTGHN